MGSSLSVIFIIAVRRHNERRCTSWLPAPWTHSLLSVDTTNVDVHLVFQRRGLTHCCPSTQRTSMYILSSSAVDSLIAVRRHNERRCTSCLPAPWTHSLLSVDTTNVDVHLVFQRRGLTHCCPSTQRTSMYILSSSVVDSLIAVRRHNERRCTSCLPALWTHSLLSVDTTNVDEHLVFQRCGLILCCPSTQRTSMYILSSSAVDSLIAVRRHNEHRCTSCLPAPWTHSLLSVDTTNVDVHLVFQRRGLTHCCPSTQRASMNILSSSAVDSLIAVRRHNERRCTSCLPAPWTHSLLSVDTTNVDVHLVFQRRGLTHCCPSTQRTSMYILSSCAVDSLIAFFANPAGAHCSGNMLSPRVIPGTG